MQVTSEPVFLVFYSRLCRGPHGGAVTRPAARQLAVRGKNRKERLEGLVRSLSRSTDQLLLQATQRDVDDFFQHEKSFVLGYHEHVREAARRAERLTRARKSEPPPAVL